MLADANPFRYEYMHLHKIRSIVSRCPVAIQPCGLLEWHGEQNAIGLDGLKAYYVCERAITALGDGVLMPINWVGTYGFIRYPGSVVYDAETTRNLFIQIYRELIKLGFKVIVILTGHYGQWQMEQLNGAHSQMEKEAKRNNQKVKLFGWRDPDLVPHLNVSDHAGKYETSMLMRTGEAWGLPLVDLDRWVSGEQKMPFYQLVAEKGKKIPVREREVWKWEHDLKDPSVCNSTLGEKIIAAESAAMVIEILDALSELGITAEPKIARAELEKMVFEK